MIKQDHIIRLVSFIVDRDVFLKHNDNNMFYHTLKDLIWIWKRTCWYNQCRCNWLQHFSC